LHGITHGNLGALHVQSGRSPVRVKEFGSHACIRLAYVGNFLGAKRKEQRHMNPHNIKGDHTMKLKIICIIAITVTFHLNASDQNSDIKYLECQNNVTTNSLKRIAFCGNAFYAVAGKRTVYSVDGNTWYADTTNNYQGPDLWGLSEQNSTIVAVGLNGTVLEKLSYLSEWEVIPYVPTKAWLTDVTGIPTSSSPRFIAVGDSGTIMIATDPWLWVKPVSPTTHLLYSVTTNGSRAVAVGWKGTIVYSDFPFDVWKQVETDTTIDYFGVKYIGDEFKIVGTKGTIATFKNDSLSNLIQIGSTLWLTDICFFQNRFIVIDYGFGKIYQSSNGIDWKMTDSFGKSLCSIAQDDSNCHVVIVGDNGVILTNATESSIYIDYYRRTMATNHSEISNNNESYLNYTINGKLLRKELKNAKIARQILLRIPVRDKSEAPKKRQTTRAAQNCRLD
jgi:hypothetical protein